MNRNQIRAAVTAGQADSVLAALPHGLDTQLGTQFGRTARQLAERTGAVTVLVSHRFSTVRMADLIVVLHHGQVTEVGSHIQLLDAGGRYAEMFKLQARGYR